MAVIARPRSIVQDPVTTLAWAAVMLIAALSAWLAVVGCTVLAREHNLWAAINGARGRMIGPGLIVFVVAIMLAEQRWPAVRRPLLARAHLVDAAYLALFAVCVAPLLALVATGFALEVERHAPWLLLSRLPLVPQLALVVTILVAQDAIMWCAHVANHRFRALWRLHALHHSQEDLSVLSTFRTHPLIHATYLPSALPAIVLASSGSLPTSALVVYACLITLPHANLPWRLGALGRVIVSPAYHRAHHARELGAQGNVNFGFALVLWDQLAHRAVFPKGAGPVETGVAGRS